MTALTPEALEEYLRNEDVKSADEWQEEFSWTEFRYEEFAYETPWGKMEVVECKGGNEGGGEEAWLVFRVGDTLFRKAGYYQSYDGLYLDGELERVEAFEKTVTDYRRV